MKCLYCDNEAKWISNKYPSPLCSKCARKEVNKLLDTGNFNPDETAVGDFFKPIVVIEKGNIVKFNHTTGEISLEDKH